MEPSRNTPRACHLEETHILVWVAVVILTWNRRSAPTAIHDIYTKPRSSSAAPVSQEESPVPPSESSAGFATPLGQAGARDFRRPGSFVGCAVLTAGTPSECERPADHRRIADMPSKMQKIIAETSIPRATLITHVCNFGRLMLHWRSSTPRPARPCTTSSRTPSSSRSSALSTRSSIPPPYRV